MNLPTDHAVLRQDYLPRHLEPAFIENGFHGCLAVATTPGQTRELLTMARGNAFIRGVIGSIDPDADDLEQLLDSGQGLLRGVTCQLSDDSRDDPSATLERIIRRIAPYQLVLDVALDPRHFPVVSSLAGQYPDQRIVLEHLGLSPSGKSSSDFDAWADGLPGIAAAGNVYCKLSGLVNLVPPDPEAPMLALDPYMPWLKTAMECFTPVRLMYGSDWPVCTLHATWDEVHDIVDNFTLDLPIPDREQIFGRTAAACYRLDT